jgi:uncharacterized protein with PIN domain
VDRRRHHAGAGLSVPVACPGCGRRYDAALFTLGRTLHCTCGARVGLPRTPAAPEAGAPRFAADAMLGRLARWLRLLGFDTSFEAHVPDETLVRRALLEERTVLTRDRRLPEEWTLVPVCVLRAEDLRGQLAELGLRFALGAHARPFTRCNRCNAPLEPATPEAIAAGVPRRVRASQRDFLRCPSCGRIYWAGSHVARIRALLEA